MIQDKDHHHDPSMGDNGSKWEIPGKEGNLPMLGHVVSLLSALVSIVDIINENLGKYK